ncbi:MAG TPA: YdcF family protein [Pyrinomonadaceae bacterium]|nr:YdcF family protein [Pyrinomonadaceae bacterium]
MDAQILALAETIWNYHRMKHQVAKGDAILVLCSHDERVAERGAQLFLEGWAPLIIFSGGRGEITKRLWDEPEAVRFARIAMNLNVPRESILVEPNSTNTGENVQFTKKLLEERGLNPHKFIVVQKPYMERRAFATFRRYWPEKDVVVTSPQVSLREYLAEYSNRSLSASDVVGIMVGDLQRIKLYPALGYQIAQEIPDEVWTAFEGLVRAGYDKYLVPQEGTNKATKKEK